MYDVMLALYNVEFTCCRLDDGKLDFLYAVDKVFVMGSAVNDSNGVNELIMIMIVVCVVATYGIGFFVAL